MKKIFKYILFIFIVFLVIYLLTSDSSAKEVGNTISYSLENQISYNKEIKDLINTL